MNAPTASARICGSQSMGDVPQALKRDPFSRGSFHVIVIASRDSYRRGVRISWRSRNMFGGAIMRKAKLRALIALLSVGLATAGAFAKEKRIDAAKDLTVEMAEPTAHRAGKPLRTRAVQVSLMPVGPSTIAIGTPMRFKMVSLANGFGHLYVLSASGRTQLWLENVRLRAGQPLRYPHAGQIVRAASPAGDETVIFVASRDRVDGFAGREATTTPLDLQITHEGLRTAILQKFGAMPRESWAFAEVQIRVHD